MSNSSKSPNRALGRGLEALFQTENLDMNTIERIEKEYTKDEIIQIRLEDLRPNPYQPRKNFEENALNELAESIREHGVFQPIIVKKSIKGFEIIAGERRYRASKIAGLETIPAVVRELTDQQMMEIALLENLQREDLSAIEEAMAYQSLIDKLKITQEDLGKRVGKSRSHITNMLGLLRLPKDIQNHVLTGQLSMGHARVLSKIEDEELVRLLANKIIIEDLSVRQIESIMASRKEENEPKKPVIQKPLTNFKYAEELLRTKLTTNVKIDDKKITINYTSIDDLNRILEIVGAIEE